MIVSIKTCPRLSDVILEADSPEKITLQDVNALKSLVLDFKVNRCLTCIQESRFMIDSVLPNLDRFYIRTGRSY